MIEFWEDFVYDIKHIRSSIIGFFDSVYNFWKYREIIWRDRFWDGEFLLDFIDAKLKDMDEHWVHDTWAEDDLETLGIIQELRYRLKLIQDDNQDDYKKRQELIEDFFSFLGKHVQYLWD